MAVFRLSIDALRFGPLQVVSVAAFSESPIFANVEIFGGQTRQFRTGKNLASWGATLELSTALETPDPDAVLRQLLEIESRGAPVAIAYNGTYDGLYRIGVSATERKRAHNRITIGVTLEFKGSTTAIASPPQPLPPSISPWSRVARIASNLERQLDRL